MPIGDTVIQVAELLVPEAMQKAGAGLVGALSKFCCSLGLAKLARTCRR